MTVSNRRLDLHYMAMQCGFWALFAAIVSYQAALLQGRGFSNSEIGVLVAVRCLAGIILQPLLGGWADRHTTVPLKHIVNLSMAISLVFGLWFTFDPGLGFAPTVLIFVVLGGLELSSYPLMDAMAVQFIQVGVPIRYSLGRGLGSLSFAVTCVLLGLQAGRFGVESTLITHAVLAVVEMLLVATFPTFRAPEVHFTNHSGEMPHSSWYLLRHYPRFTLMLVGLFFGITAVLPLSNFLINILQAKGGGEAQLGLALFLMGASELPGSMVFTKLRSRGIPSARLLLLSQAFILLKAAALLIAPTVGAILLIQPIQMLGYGVFTPASVFYVSDTIPPVDQVRGQTLMMVASNGMGGVVGGLLAGKALDLGQAAGSGAGLMLLVCVACAVVSVILTFAASNTKRT